MFSHENIKKVYPQQLKQNWRFFPYGPIKLHSNHNLFKNYFHPFYFWLAGAQPGAVLPDDSDSDEGIADGVGHFGSGQNVPEMSDFDMMMELQKAQRRRRKKKVRNLKSQKKIL